MGSIVKCTANPITTTTLSLALGMPQALRVRKEHEMVPLFMSQVTIRAALG